VLNGICDPLMDFTLFLVYEHILEGYLKIILYELFSEFLVRSMPFEGPTPLSAKYFRSDPAIKTKVFYKMVKWPQRSELATVQKRTEKRVQGVWVWACSPNETTVVYKIFLWP